MIAPRQTMHVAGVGASAGGLEAMLPMFAAMPATGRIAFVVAQHMAKNGHDELVVRLIGRESALPVVLAEEGMRLAADTVYVIPSGKDGRVADGTLSLVEPAAEHVSTPSVNALFTSLAESGQRQAIGIVLSGTGSDGTAGCRAIQKQGGLTLVQDPREAKFDGMPQSAIEARVVDQVLPVQGIGATLGRLFPGLVVPPAITTSAVAETDSSELERLLHQVREATGIDFSSYKPDTLMRRLEKRKAVLGIESPEDYQGLIRRQPDELHILQGLFLVSVSSFFRDAASFQVLASALAQRLADKPTDQPIRIWVPGCASGDEPYSLAILARELGTGQPIEIIATDLNPEALAVAREGVYRAASVKEMPPDLLERYFIAQGPLFAIKPEIKDCVRFEQRDLFAGPPPGELDLVSCRNLLIYLKSHLQDRLIKTFHQALRSHGLLFIGQAESLSFVGNSLFVAIDHGHRLFRRRH